MGYPSEAGPFGRRRVFRRFSAHFLRDSGIPIFQAPKRRRRICAPEICAPKICAKICAPRIYAPKTVSHIAKTVSHIPVFRKMEAKKTHNKKKSAPNLRKTPAPRGLGKGAGAKGSPVFLKPSKISLHSIPPHWGPTEPPSLSLGQGGGAEWESEKASASEIPEPRP